MSKLHFWYLTAVVGFFHAELNTLLLVDQGCVYLCISMGTLQTAPVRAGTKPILQA